MRSFVFIILAFVFYLQLAKVAIAQCPASVLLQPTNACNSGICGDNTCAPFGNCSRQTVNGSVIVQPGCRIEIVGKPQPFDNGTCDCPCGNGAGFDTDDKIIIDGTEWEGSSNSCVGLTKTVENTGSAPQTVAFGMSVNRKDEIARFTFTCLGPAVPSTVVNLSEPCFPTKLVRVSEPPSGVTWYWQTTEYGTNTLTPGTLSVNISGTYYLRARNNSTGVWSCGSLAKVVNVLGNKPQFTSAGQNISICENDSATFVTTLVDTTGITFIWKKGNQTLAGQNKRTLKLTNLKTSDAGNYTCIASGSCSVTDTSGAFVLNVSPKKSININQSVCQGDSVLFNGIVRKATGNYVANLKTASGCDSVVTLSLVVNQPDTSIISATICEGDSFVADNKIYKTEGSFKQLTKTTNGCDSLIQLTLTVNQKSVRDTTVVVCENKPVVIYSQSIVATGTYLIDFNDANNCKGQIKVTAVTNTDVCGRYFVPNLITPNDDGFNDIWELPILGLYKQVNVELIDRWGKKVYSKTNYDNSFNADNMPSGMYYYKMDLISNNNQDRLVGWLHVIK